MNALQDKRAEMQAKRIEKSLQIALQAYPSKTDKAGREYILHPRREL